MLRLFGCKKVSLMLVRLVLQKGVMIIGIESQTGR
jgi:hypothetical protein